MGPGAAASFFTSESTGTEHEIYRGHSSLASMSRLGRPEKNEMVRHRTNCKTQLRCKTVGYEGQLYSKDKYFEVGNFFFLRYQYQNFARKESSDESVLS